jgi:uncharacterized protein YfaT (DUF1175 family)
LRPVRALFILAALLAYGSTSPRLDSSADRKAFRRWFTFLAESRYYARKPLRDVSDAEGLLRWAYHQALRPHDASWFRSVELPILPAMPSVQQYNSAPEAVQPTLISRDLKDAEPGDLLLYRRSDLHSHLMIYIGQSQVVPSPKKWVIYLAKSVKDVHKVSLESLREDPSPEWRPTEENPEFLGVWRLDILRDNL